MQRNIVGIIAVGLIAVGMFLLMVFGGMLDNPGSPITPAVFVGLAALAFVGCGVALANLYERGRTNG